jgi:hypothetical protein
MEFEAPQTVNMYRSKPSSFIGSELETILNVGSVGENID